ncbi:MAG: phosphotransferase family protein [Bacteroidota bacterium]
MSEMTIDQPQAVRDGEALDKEKLSAHLQQVFPELGSDIDIQQFPSGFSNLTYWVKMGAREMVLRRPPFGAQVKSGHDMSREYRVLKALKPVFDKVPAVYHYTEDVEIMGSPFYLMERVKGVILRGKGPTEEPGEQKKIYPQAASAWIDTMVELHQVDYEKAGLGALGRPQGYTRRQIEGWTRRYRKVATENDPVIDKVIQWLNDHIPAETDNTLIHNDYKYDNVVFHPENWNQIIAILDWEMATLGDPLMDLGTSIAYWVNSSDPAALRQLGRMPTYHPGNPTRSELLEMYATRSGRDVGNFSFYFAYGLFKIAVIIQQIYYRYKLGHTQDPRFAQLNHHAVLFFHRAWMAIDSGKIDGV